MNAGKFFIISLIGAIALFTNVGHAGVLKLGDLVQFCAVPSKEGATCFNIKLHPLSEGVNTLNDIIVDPAGTSDSLEDFLIAISRDFIVHGHIGRVLLNAEDLSVMEMSSSAEGLFRNPLIKSILKRERNRLFNLRVSIHNDWTADRKQNAAIAALPFYRRWYTALLPQPLTGDEVADSRLKALEFVPLHVIDSILNYLEPYNFPKAGTPECAQFLL